MALQAWFPPLRSESDKLRNLDLLRLIASYAIVVHHFRSYGLTGHYAPQLHWWWLPLFVDLFFTISGFVICFVYFDRMESWADYGRFMQRRIGRLVPLHWATLFAFSLIGLSLYLGVKVEEPDKYNWQCFLPNLFMVHSLGVCDRLTFNYASWSISAEMLIYLFFPLFCFFLRRGPWLPLLLGIAGIAALAFRAPSSPDPEKFWVILTYDFGFERGIPSFLIGMSLYGLRDRLALLPRPDLLMYGLLAIFIALGLVGIRPFYLLPLVYVIAASAIAADRQGRIAPLAAKVSVGGQLTYSIYMLHPLVGTLMLALVGKHLLHLGTAAMSAWCLLGGAVVFGVGYLSFVYFETPMRHWVSRINLRREAPAIT